MHAGSNKEEFSAPATQLLPFHGRLQKHDGTANGAPILSRVPYPLLQQHAHRPKEPAPHGSFSPSLHCWECVCHRLIQRANLHEKWETIMGDSCFLLPHGAQYDENPLPQLIRPQNHRSLLVDPITAHPYPLVEVGSFTMQDPLFPGTVGDGYVYWGDAWKWLEERGYQVLKYTGTGPEVPLAVSTSASMLTSGAGDAIVQGGMLEPDSTLSPAATTNGTITADLMPAPEGRVHHQCPVSRSPSHETKKVWLDDSNSSGATLSLIGDGSASFKSLAPTPVCMPQFTSTPGKATTEARACSLSRDRDSLTGPHDQTEVFLTDFGWPLPPPTPIPSIPGSQPVGGSVYAPPLPLTIDAGSTTLNSAQVEELYTLASECRLLSIRLACGFCQLSGEEAVSRLQALTTAQEILHKPQRDPCNAWEESYVPLIVHVTKLDAKLGMYLDDANKDMTDKAMEIWMRIQAMAMASDMTPNVHLGLALFLLDRLSVISLGLSFWQDIPFSLALGPKAITFQRRASTSRSIPPVPNDLGAAQSNSRASLPLAQAGQATLRSLERNFLDEPEKLAPVDFKKAPPLKHSSPLKSM